MKTLAPSRYYIIFIFILLKLQPSVGEYLLENALPKFKSKFSLRDFLILGQVNFTNLSLTPS